jgi:hypothetical protein
MVGKRNAYKIWAAEDGKRSLRGTRRRWMNNIKIHLRQIGWGGMIWIDVVHATDQWRALVNMVLNLRAPLSAGKLAIS